MSQRAETNTGTRYNNRIKRGKHARKWNIQQLKSSKDKDLKGVANAIPTAAYQTPPLEVS